jgi:hypothetical protein
LTFIINSTSLITTDRIEIVSNKISDEQKKQIKNKVLFIIENVNSLMNGQTFTIKNNIQDIIDLIFQEVGFESCQVIKQNGTIYLYPQETNNYLNIKMNIPGFSAKNDEDLRRYLGKIDMESQSAISSIANEILGYEVQPKQEKDGNQTTLVFSGNPLPQGFYCNFINKNSPVNFDSGALTINSLTLFLTDFLFLFCSLKWSAV